MVDFAKLKNKKNKINIVDPVEIFRRSPKPFGMNDLYSSQKDILSKWFNSKDKAEHIIKLHTGGGKTLVGLLIAQSTINEGKGPVIYLTPNNQLVKQTIDKAKDIGVKTVEYQSGKVISDEFLNGKAVLVANYNSFFNGHSKFGTYASTTVPNVGLMIFDDAHAAIPTIRECFSININSKDEKFNIQYQNLCSLFRQDFKEIGKLGTFDEVVSGDENIVLEVPYWSWEDKKEAVRTILTDGELNKDIAWPLLRDNLSFCHALISSNTFSITSIQPILSLFPSFVGSARKVYMSATIADDSDIIKNFNISEKSVENTLEPESIAGVSERMILIPSLMDADFDVLETMRIIIDWAKTKAKNSFNSVIISPSDREAEKWEPDAKFVKGSEMVKKTITELQESTAAGAFSFSNRYDGIDLPNEACRLLVLNGLPQGTSVYELYRARVLEGGSSLNRILAQRIEQGLGRGARGGSDYCVTVLVGSTLTSWISKSENTAFLTNVTNAQLKIGEAVSKQVKDQYGLLEVIIQCLERSNDWLEYYSGQLPEELDQLTKNKTDIKLALIERQAFDNWVDNNHTGATGKINYFISKNPDINKKEKGWIEQLNARIYYSWGNKKKAMENQKDAYANNRNLLRPQTSPVSLPNLIITSQAKKIVDNIKKYDRKKGILDFIDTTSSYLVQQSTAHEFEENFCLLGNLMGFNSERFDDDGIGPDIVMLLNNQTGLIIEAKSRKHPNTPFKKEVHGQLLVAEKWFEDNFSSIKEHINVSIHPNKNATKQSWSHATKVLSYEKIDEMINDTKQLYEKLIESSLTDDSLLNYCQQILEKSQIKDEVFVESYLTNFKII